MLKSKKLLSAFLQCSSLTGVSRILGLVRDVCCAHYFGASASFDAFLVAFQIPNFMRRLFAEGAMNQAFVPVFSECQAKEPKKRQMELMQRSLGMLLIGLITLTTIVMLFAPFVIKLYAPGFAKSSYRLKMAVDLLYWTFPYLSFISIAAFFAAILNCQNKFIASSAAPILLNLCLIAGAVWAGSHQESIWGLGYAVPLAGVLQMSLLIWQSFKHSGLILPKWQLQDPGVRKIWRLILGALFGVSVSQIGLIIDTLLASFLPDGSISWLYFSQRLVFLPIGLFGVAAATVVLPKLSSSISSNQNKATINWATALIITLSIPSLAGLVILAKPILITLFNYGKFSFADILQTQKSLVALALGLPAFMLNKILIAAFYAKQNIKTPIKIASYSLIANIVFALIFMQYFAHAGIAFALAMSAWLQLGLLANKLIKIALWQIDFVIMTKVLLATSVMSVGLCYLLPDIGFWVNSSVGLKCFRLFGLTFIGCVVYALCLKLFKWQVLLPNKA